MIIDAKSCLTKAKRDKKAVGAFNVSSIEALQAVFEAASSLKSIIFVTTSFGESKYLTPELVVEICSKLSQIYKVDYCVHLDHGEDYNWIKRCLDAGYNSIHIDYGEVSYKENLENTKKVRELTYQYGAQLEGEIGIVPLCYYRDKIEDNLELTNPDLAYKYVQETEIDSLAVSIGTQSGKYKKIKPLDIETLRKLNRLLPEIPFVLHGGSFLSVDMYDSCINKGVAKININTEIRLAYTNKLKTNIKQNSDEYAPYRLLKGVKEYIEDIVRKKIKVFSRI